MPDTNMESTDKWEALELLTEAAERYELSHRSLGVLRALMTFLPGRLITPMPHEAIVFPSNRTLANRLNGMPESTLRRHLAHLVNAGIVSRRNSPNCKRFARRAGGSNGIAFGFDLSPLARHAAQLRADAAEAREAREVLCALRAKLISLRHAALIHTGPTERTEAARKALRRKLNATELRTLCKRFQDEPKSEEMSGTDTQIERHIQTKTITSSDSETLQTNLQPSKKTTAENVEQDSAHLLSTCTTYQTYFPEPLRHWNDVGDIAQKICPMISIDNIVFHDAVKTMGQIQASVVVLWILDKLNEIRNPGGYLRHLTKLSRAGGFTIKPLIQNTVDRADCQLTT